MPEIRIKLRTDTAQQWTLENPMLSRGEPGFEYDTSKLKIGDGINSWNDLPYIYSMPDSEPKSG